MHSIDYNDKVNGQIFIDKPMYVFFAFTKEAEKPPSPEETHPGFPAENKRGFPC